MFVILEDADGIVIETEPIPCDSRNLAYQYLAVEDGRWCRRDHFESAAMMEGDKVMVRQRVIRCH